MEEKKKNVFVCPRCPQSMSELVSVCHLLSYALCDVPAQSSVVQDGLLSVLGVCEGINSVVEFMASAQSTLSKKHK